MLMLACFLGVNSFAQIEIRQPFMIDSTNNKGEKFNYNSVLQIPPVEQLKKKNIFKSVVSIKLACFTLLKELNSVPLIA